MDRNRLQKRTSRLLNVALRKESVDRNHVRSFTSKDKNTVALRKESVDRNGCGNILVMSENLVALRKESVDRNMYPK